MSTFIQALFIPLIVPFDEQKLINAFFITVVFFYIYSKATIQLLILLRSGNFPKCESTFTLPGLLILSPGSVFPPGINFSWPEDLLQYIL